MLSQQGKLVTQHGSSGSLVVDALQARLRLQRVTSRQNSGAPGRTSLRAGRGPWPIRQKLDAVRRHNQLELGVARCCCCHCNGSRDGSQSVTADTLTHFSLCLLSPHPLVHRLCSSRN